MRVERIHSSSAASELLMRESIRNASLLFLLSEDSKSKGADDPPEDDKGGDPAADPAADDEDSELDSFFDSQGNQAIKDLDKMLKVLQAKSESGAVALFPGVTKLVQNGKSRVVASITNADDSEKMVAAISSLKLFLASISYLLASTAKRVKEAGKDKDDQTVATTLGDGDEAKGKSELQKLIASKFAPAPAAWKAIRAIKSALNIEEGRRAQLTVPQDLNDDMFLEAVTNDADLLNEGLLDWFMGLFKSDAPPAGKASVKALTTLFKGPIDTVLLDDLSKASSKDIHNLVMKNVGFFKSFVTNPPKVTPPTAGGGGSDKGGGGDGGGGGGGSSGGGGAPTTSDVKNVTDISSADRSKISSSLEDEYGSKISQAFIEIATGKKKLEEFDGTMKEILSVLIKSLSTQVDKGEKPNTGAVTDAVNTQVLNIKPDVQSFIKDLIGDEGFNSLTKALLGDSEARKALRLETAHRQTTLKLIESSLSRKSLSFLFEGEMPEKVKTVLVKAVEPHVKGGKKPEEVAQQIFDKITGGKAGGSSGDDDKPAGTKGNAKQAEYKGKFVKASDGEVYKMGDQIGWYPVKKRKNPAVDAQKLTMKIVKELNQLAKDGKFTDKDGNATKTESDEPKRGEIRKVDGKDMISLGLAAAGVEKGKRQGVLDAVKKSLKQSGKLGLDGSGYPLGGEEVQNVAKPILDAASQLGMKKQADRKAGLADRLIESEQVSDSLIIERWQRLAGIL